MELEHILHAIDDFNNGIIGADNGIVRSFLYRQRWYPLRRVVNHAHHLAHEAEHTVDVCTKDLAYVMPYLRIENITFEQNGFVGLNNEEILQEARYISEVLRQTIEPIE